MNHYPDQDKGTVLVTGVAGNLGRAVADELSASGFKVIGAGRGKPIDDRIPLKAFYQADLSSFQSVNELFDLLQYQHPDLNAGVFLAGGFLPGTLENTDNQIFDKMLEGNFLTAFFPASALFSQLRQRGRSGRMVFAGSGAGFNPDMAIGAVAYGLSKSLLHHLTGIINAESSGHGIFASVIVLPTLDTPSNRAAMPDADRSAWVSLPIAASRICAFLSGNGGTPVIRP
jgi:NAD(P)-dependent dehydrogenase (short-subunit alcohol dehydrogenase family)